MLCSSCGNTEIPFTTEDHQEGSQVSDEVPGDQKIDAVLQDKLTYSNLDSESSMSEVRDILTKAGIQTSFIQRKHIFYHYFLDAKR